MHLRRYRPFRPAGSQVERRERRIRAAYEEKAAAVAAAAAAAVARQLSIPSSYHDAIFTSSPRRLPAYSLQYSDSHRRRLAKHRPTLSKHRFTPIKFSLLERVGAQAFKKGQSAQSKIKPGKLASERMPRSGQG